MTMSYKNTVMILNKLNPHRLANHKYTAKTHFYENVACSLYFGLRLEWSHRLLR